MTSDAPSSSPTPNHTASQFTPRQLFWLKFTVIGMAVLMIIGMAIVVARVIEISSRMGSSGDAAAAEMAIELPAGTVSAIGLDGNRMAVLVDSPDGRRIAVFDLTTGAAVRRFRVQRGKRPEAPRLDREGRSEAGSD
ncbi:MAG: DUF6476 family protein [Pseudomonadota bacterium]